MGSLKGSTNVFDNDSTTSSTSQDKTSNPRTTEKFSLFGDTSCGEPLFAQRLRIDFTPNEEFDNDYVQNKCCKFWNFIDSLPEIQNLMVLPEKDSDFMEMSQSHEASARSTSKLEEKIEEEEEIKGKTALSVLELVEEQGLIDRAFEAKIKESHCTLGSREYKELQNIKQPKKKTKTAPCLPCHRQLCKDGDSSSGPCTCSHGQLKKTPLKALIKDMEDWDAQHPKSMEPPRHPPSLQHCIL